MIFINSSPKNAAKMFQSFMPVYVPIGIGYLAAVMEREGFPFKIIDEQVEEDTFEKIAEYVTSPYLPVMHPYIFAFSVLTASYKVAVETAKKVKEIYPDSKIIFGGPHPSALPEEVLQHEWIDIVVKGEGEVIVPELYRRIKSGHDYSDIKGISFRKGTEIIHNERSTEVIDLDKLPPFPYHLFGNNPKYDMGFIVSSRGCPFSCVFCSNRVTTGKRYRYRSPESTVEELCALYETYKPEMILFLDDNFLVNRERIYRMIDLIKEKGLHKKTKFSFQARGDSVDYQILQDLYTAGFHSVFFGIETSSEEIMKIIRKGETVAECIAAVKMAKEIGFHVSATFIYGLPTETHQIRMDCARLANELEIDMVRFNNATPYPGTELYDIAKNNNNLYIQGDYENFNSVSTFIENPFHPTPFSYVPEGMTEGEIRNDIIESYFKFYLHIGKLKRMLSRRDEGVGWFNLNGSTFDKIAKLSGLITISFYMAVKFVQMITFKINDAHKMRSI
jgi:anaerobic magnesium-protoporphyrin IX monomethyl ester cyclase